MAFHNLQKDKQEEIANYELMVYFCSGTDSEKLEWFRTINIAGVKLREQELRNATYTGLWLTDAKKYFSKTSCPAHKISRILVLPGQNSTRITALIWSVLNARQHINHQ